MRTKTLLITAALSAVGVASSMAQVFSQNAVGYYTKDLLPGFNLIANQLNSGDNSLNTIIPDGNPGLDNANILKWDSANQMFFDADTYFNGAGWLDPTLSFPSTTTLAPGEGAFLRVDGAVSIVLVGEVPQGDLAVSIPTNLGLISQATPQSLAVDAAGDEIPSGDNDQILFWNAGAQRYDDAVTFFIGVGWLDATLTNPVTPTPGVGEAFFYSRDPNNGVASWDRTFSVN